MNELIDKIYDEARSAWRFRWIGMAVAALAAIVGWAVVFALPDKYESYASIFVDTRTALKPVLQGLTVEQDVNAQLNYVRQSLLSGEMLERIAHESGVLAQEESDPRKVASALTDFSRRVELGVRSASNSPRESEREAGGSIYSFTYQDGNRERSLKVMNTLLKVFVEETLGGKRAGSANAQKFLEAEIKDYEQRLRAAENKLAEFKKVNIGLMPTEQGGYFGQLQNEIDFTRKLENDLHVAVARRAELSKQLRGESVLGATSSPQILPGGVVAGGGDTVSRIKEVQARLDELLLRFTEKHPDVIATRATLEELKKRRDSEIESLKRGDAGAAAASGVSTNPVYQNIQLQLNQVDVEIASLRGQLSQHETKAAELKRRLDTAPKVEAEFAQLNRDYDINKAQYTALLANYEKSQLGERADDAGSVRFDLVQPPNSPFSPVSPRRTLLLAAVLLVSLCAGVGLTYGLHLLNPVVGSMRSLAELTGATVLGVVSPAFPQFQATRRRSEVLRFVGAGSLLLVVFGCTIVLNLLGFRVPHSGAG
jgi:polysaccharide chain length determinant protein (PEP-CTERM system associated)